MGTHDEPHRTVSDFQQALPGLTPVLTFVGTGPITFTHENGEPFEFVTTNPNRIVALWKETVQRTEQIARAAQAMRETVRGAARTAAGRAAEERRKEARHTRDTILAKYKKLRKEGEWEERELAKRVYAGLKNDARTAGDPPESAPSLRTVRRVLAAVYGPAAARGKDA